MNRSIITLALACAPAKASSPPDLPSYCDQHICEPAPESCPECGPTILCCPFSGDPCFPVAYLSWCDLEYSWLVVCSWGQTLEDGTFVCFDD